MQKIDGDIANSEPPLNIATVGSKNRVCLPPTLVRHHSIQSKDYVIWIPKRDKNGKPYSIMHVVKPENFEIDDEEIVTIADTLKSSTTHH